MEFGFICFVGLNVLKFVLFDDLVGFVIMLVFELFVGGVNFFF